MPSKSNKKIKNIIIINDFNYTQGGATKVAIQTANLLVPKIENVYFFSGSKEKSNELDKNVKDIYTEQGEALKDKNKLRGIINGLYNFKAKKELKNLLSTLNRDETIIHVHGWTKCLSSSVFDIAFKMKFKVVLTLHDYFSACPNGGFFNYKSNQICYLKPMSWKCIKCNCDSRNYGFKMYRLLRQFIQNNIVKLTKKLKYAIGISDLNIKILKDNFNSNTEIFKIYNPINVNKDEKIDNWYQNKYYLYVGRVDKEKGVETFCKAITELNLNGIVVGDGNEYKYLKNKYKNINFVGWKNKQDVNRYIKESKCLIFPSLWYETAGLTILEAESFNIPCIVSATCAGAEFIEENKNGFLFRTGNVEDLKKKIQKLENKELNKIENNVEKFYDTEYIENLIACYKK